LGGTLEEENSKRTPRRTDSELDRCARGKLRLREGFGHGHVAQGRVPLSVPRNHVALICRVAWATGRNGDPGAQVTWRGGQGRVTSPV
jgi:hypothetical protein